MQKRKIFDWHPCCSNCAGIKITKYFDLLSITKEGIVDFTCQTTAFKTESFTKFIDNLLTHISMKSIPKAVIIFDNVPFHKSNSIKEKFTEGNHILFFYHHISECDRECVCKMEVAHPTS